MPRTDVLGMVQFEPDPQLRGLIVVNGAGYASASWKTLTMDPTLRMQPWGSLEVSFNPASRGSKRMFQFSLGDQAASGVAMDREGFAKEVDEQGRLVYPMVPPGKHKLCRQYATKVGNDTAWRSGPAIDVDVLPGTTTRVHLTPQGHTVVAKMILPSTVQRHPSMNLNAIIDTPFPEPPPHIRKVSGVIDQDALRLWQQSPEYLAAQARHQQFPLEESPNGLLTAEEVPPGVYRITVSLTQQPTATGGPAQVYEAMRNLEIPSEPGTGTIDLGEIALQAVKVP
jgi:hypothetical protein